MADYQAMWKDLGMDLETHDQLCAVLPMAFGDTYLTQENRPENMAFYDFVVSEIHGVRPAELIELQKQGGKVFGTFCVFVPDEVVVACRRRHGAVRRLAVLGARRREGAAQRHLPADQGVAGRAFRPDLPLFQRGRYVRGRDHVRRQEEGLRDPGRRQEDLRHGRAADEAREGRRGLEGRDRAVRQRGGGRDGQRADGREPGGRHPHHQREAARAGARVRGAQGRPGAHQRQGRPAHDADRVLRRPGALRRDGKQAGRRAGSAHRARRGRGSSRHEAHPDHGNAAGHPELEAAPYRRDERRRGGVRRDVHGHALLRERGGRGRGHARRHVPGAFRALHEEQLRVLHAEPRPHRGRGAWSTA